MTRDEEVEQLQSEFEEWYWAFVYRGGLDTRVVTDEDYERDYRRSVHCIHSLPRQRCPNCRKQIPAYVSYY
mgnify:FL=1